MRRYLCSGTVQDMYTVVIVQCEDEDVCRTILREHYRVAPNTEWRIKNINELNAFYVLTGKW